MKPTPTDLAYSHLDPATLESRQQWMSRVESACCVTRLALEAESADGASNCIKVILVHAKHKTHTHTLETSQCVVFLWCPLRRAPRNLQALNKDTPRSGQIAANLPTKGLRPTNKKHKLRVSLRFPPEKDTSLPEFLDFTLCGFAAF